MAEDTKDEGTTEESTNDEGYQFDYWEGDIGNSDNPMTTIVMNENETVTAHFISTRACGDDCHPYPPKDYNQNCYVDLPDLAIFMADWLDCTKPYGCD